MGGVTGLLLLLWVGVTVSTVVDLQKRIRGGHTCEKTERLYHVKITDGNNKFVCGGSLISKQWILTAAHCKRGIMKAVLGVHPGPGNPVQITDQETFKDKDNKNNDREHDIMLLKLPHQITHITPIDLPDCKNYPKPSLNKGATVQVAGHGPTDTEPFESKTLQCADFKVVDCPWVGNPNTNPKPHEHRFCGQTNGVYTCPGDSGGGVVYDNKIYGVHVAIGGCDTASRFMDVCGYIGWINTYAKP